MKILRVIVGAYGSGKSEYAINEAFKSKKTGKDTVLVDLDVVNPYFRSRDVKDSFEKIGIKVISPKGEYRFADLPMLSKDIYQCFQNNDSTVIFDVGGDPAGCRALARYTDLIKKYNYNLEFVVNTNRPFTNTEESILKMFHMIETSSRLRIKEIICNSNLMEFTDEKVVENGVILLEKVSKNLNIKFEKYLVLDKYDEIIPDNICGKNKITIQHFLLKPWENYNIQGL